MFWRVIWTRVSTTNLHSTFIKFKQVLPYLSRKCFGHMAAMKETEEMDMEDAGWKLGPLGVIKN